MQSLHMNVRKYVEYFILAGVFVLLFVLRSDYNSEDGMIFWKFIFLHAKGRVVDHFMYVFPAHPLWSQMYLLLYTVLQKIIMGIDAKTVGNLMSAFFGALSAFYYYKMLRLLKEPLRDALFCTLLLVCSYSFVIYGTTVNTGIMAIFSVNFFLFYYFKYLSSGMTVLSSAALGAILVAACLFYLSPIVILPAVVTGICMKFREPVRVIATVAIVALVSLLLALAAYRFIYYYLTVSNYHLADCVKYVLAMEGSLHVKLTLAKRITFIVSNIGGIYVGGGLAGFYAGLLIVFLFVIFVRGALARAWYKDVSTVVLAAAVFCALFVGSYGGACQYPKQLIGFLGPMTYILYKSLMMLKEMPRNRLRIFNVKTLLAGLIGCNLFYMAYPYSPSHIFGHAAPNDVATKAFYQYLKKSTPEDAVILYDSGYVGKNFGNFVMFFAERESFSFSESGILFLGGDMPFDTFLERYRDANPSCWLISTRGAFERVYLPTDRMFSAYAVFDRVDRYGGIGLYRYMGRVSADQFIGRYFERQDAIRVQAYDNKGGKDRLWWRSVSWDGRRSLILTPELDKRECDMSKKFLFYW